MSVIRPFRAVRPVKELAAAIAALPYDVMNSEEATEMVKDNPYSFLHVDKAEIDLPAGTDIYSDAVYEKAAENLASMSEKGWYIRDEKPCLYIYAQTMNGRTQTGIVGCASVDDYICNVIKKHEHTRADKEADRIRHVDACNANTGPIFLTYKGSDAVDGIIAKYAATEPEYDFCADGVRQTIWVIGDDKDIAVLTEAFARTESLYIADGHHRAASAVNVGKKRRAANPGYTGEEEFNYFLAVYFNASDLEIMDYNRLIKDLGGMTENEFMEKISVSFDCSPVDRADRKPTEKHTFGMYLGGKWYRLTAKKGTFDENDPVGRLDVSVLQRNLISPVLNIGDPRTDSRIDFVGGIRGLDELEKRCSEDCALAFAMYPTTLDDLMSIADAGLVMPPKSTWFEPKLLSGLFVHELG